MKYIPKIIVTFVILAIIGSIIGYNIYNNKNFEETNFKISISHDINKLEYSLNEKILKINISGFNNINKEIKLTYNQRKQLKEIISNLKWNEEKNEEINNEKIINIITKEEKIEKNTYPENMIEQLKKLSSLSNDFETKNHNRPWNALYIGAALLFASVFITLKISSLTMD